MKTVIRTLLVASAFSLPSLSTADSSTTSPGKASDWHLSLGLATVTVPSYLGDNRHRSLVAPDITVSYKGRFFASTFDGVGYNLIRQGGWRAGPIMKYNAGRRQDGDESYFISGDETDDLQGLGDIDGTAEIGGFVEYSSEHLVSRVELRQATEGHDGTVGDVSVKWVGRKLLAGKSLFYGVGPELHFADSDYMNAFFGVDAQQASLSGLEAYQAGAGLLSYGIHAAVEVPLANRVSLVGFGGVDLLGEEAVDSSLVSTRGADEQASLGVLLKVTF
ncbi:MipA/OmpV family protein [Granulosicoccus sp. 3-233]|uniref:MipA/OmpV family protein n=1 Tax=Granulosicoccus sp. 3-233 TaxID=3417969 RepID=UPI003D33C37A